LYIYHCFYSITYRLWIQIISWNVNWALQKGVQLRLFNYMLWKC
jgi:hypothetical protein